MNKVNSVRPKNLNLFTIRFPLPAIVSILHRISGFILFLLIPAMLWGLSYSFTSSGYDDLQQWLGNIYFKLFLLALLVPFCFHLVAGIRHLLSDIQLGVSLKGGKRSAQLTFVFFIIVVVLLGIWIW